MAADSDLAAWCRRYLSRCNEHRFGALAEFVASDVRVNDGEQQDLGTYVQGLRQVVQAFPDYHWDLQHLIVENGLIFAHFIDTGTHGGEFLGVPATGRRVSTRECAVYRVANGKIAEVWVAADNLHLLQQLQ